MTEPTEMELVVEAGGDVRCIDAESLDLQALGKLQITRATHVEPDLDGNWFADMGPVEGPVLGPFGTRGEALLAERGRLLGQAHDARLDSFSDERHEVVHGSGIHSVRYDLNGDGSDFPADVVCYFASTLPNEGQAHAGISSESLPPPGVEFAESRSFPNLHRESRRELRVERGAKEVVERREPGATNLVEDREVFSMRVGVADECVEECGVKQREHVERGHAGLFTHELETVGEGGAALFGVLVLRQNPKCLAEILLMDPTDTTLWIADAIVTLDQEKRPATDDARLNGGNLEPDRFGKPHHECLVLGRTFEPFDRRLEDVRGRLSWCWQRNRVVHEDNWHLRLRSGQREP